MIHDPTFHADFTYRRPAANQPDSAQMAPGPENPPGQANPANPVRPPDDVIDPYARLRFLEYVITEHDDCDHRGYCLGCRRSGLWADYPCDTRIGAERAAERTRALIQSREGRPAAGDQDCPTAVDNARHDAPDNARDGTPGSTRDDAPGSTRDGTRDDAPGSTRDGRPGNARDGAAALAARQLDRRTAHSEPSGCDPPTRRQHPRPVLRTPGANERSG